MKAPSGKQRQVEFGRSTITNADSTTESKVDFIRKGKKKKTITGFKENKNMTFENKGGKFVVVEKEKKFEDVAVTRKKRNYIMFESKLGTERDTDKIKIEGAKNLRAIQPRTEEKIVQKKKRKEYLDNYQYHETKDIKNPSQNKTCVVEHKRLGDIIGGFFEETTYERQVMTSRGNEKPPNAFRTRQTSANKTLKNAGNVKNVPSSRTEDKKVKREMRPYNSQTNFRNPASLGKVNTTTRRFSRNVENPPTTTENKKVEKRTVTKNGQTTSTTRTTSRGKSNLRKK